MAVNGEVVNSANVTANKNSTSDNADILLSQVDEAAEYILSRSIYKPQIAIICGTGIGKLADAVDKPNIINYKDIPNFATSTVVGHAGRLVIGLLGNKPVVCMQGRIHYYEGVPLWKITLPVRVFAKLGVKTLIVTNACGGLNPAYSVGDIMIMRDHIYLPGLCGFNPLVGLNDDRFGPRFPDSVQSYDSNLIELAWETAKKLKLDFFQEGVYCTQAGPCFETVAENKMIRMLGADSVGMSTAPEVCTARQVGIKCFGMSLVTNMSSLTYGHNNTVNHNDVIDVSAMRSKDLTTFVLNFIQQL